MDFNRRDFYSLPELEQLTGIGTPTIRGWIRNGTRGRKLTSYMMGGTYLVKKTDWERWVEESKVA